MAAAPAKMICIIRNCRRRAAVVLISWNGGGSYFRVCASVASCWLGSGCRRNVRSLQEGGGANLD